MSKASTIDNKRIFLPVKCPHRDCKKSTKTFAMWPNLSRHWVFRHKKPVAELYKMLEVEAV